MRRNPLIYPYVLALATFVSPAIYACCEAPVASMSRSPNPVCVGDTVTFDATGSYDPDCRCSSCGGVSMLDGIRQFEWDWTNDGTYDHTESPSAGDGIATHSYSTAGTYTCKLRVYDDDNACCCTGQNCYDKYDTTTVTVTVVDVDEVGAQPGFLTSIYVALNEPIDLEAIRYPAGQFPAGGPIWTIVSQPEGASASLSSTSGSATTTLSNVTVPGEYIVKAKCGGTDSGDEIPATGLQVFLDIDGVYDTDEEDPGGLVVLKYDNNNAPRKKIILYKAQPASWDGDLVLTRQCGTGKVEVFDSPTGGTMIEFNGSDNKFANSDIPQNGKKLWAEGDIASGIMQDVTLKLKAEGGTRFCYGDPPEDKVCFTVLWVSLSTDHTGSVEADNFGIATYRDIVVPPPDDTLGHHLYYTAPPFVERAWNGRGTELLGSLTVLDFVPTQFSTDEHALHLVRERVNGNCFWGPNGNENSEPIPSGDDTSEEIQRDDTPLSGGSPSVIYDYDAPGIVKWGAGYLTIIRKRVNYRQWAEWDPPGSPPPIRCSLKKSWFTRQSYRKSYNCDAGYPSSATSNTLTDNTKNWVPNCWVPGVVRISAEPGMGQVRRVTANTNTTITLESNWGTKPGATSLYELIDTSTWTLHNDVSGDNVSADGTTNITWNLQ